MTQAMHQMIIERLDRIETALERLEPPKGSDSGDLLPDTRSVGGNQSTKNNGSEKPLPDQGWVAPVMELRNALANEATRLQELADAYAHNENVTITLSAHREEVACVLRKFAMMADRAVGVIRTQSVADGDDLKAAIHHAIHHLIKEADRFETKARVTAFTKRPKTSKTYSLKAACFIKTVMALEFLLLEESRKERSVSGNDATQATAVSDSDKT